MPRGVPLVSYILVNWHTEELLPRALKSIAAQSYGLREIIVVNNASPAFSEGLLGEFEPLSVINNDTNRGFAAANNQAIAQSHGDMIVLLNCDAYLHPDFARHAADVFALNPRIGTVVPKTLRDDGSGIIDSTGHLMHHDRTPAHRGRGELDQGQYDSGGFVFGGCAAAIAYRREMLDAMAEGGRIADGGRVLDETFFAYYEDVDLDWRANLAGWRAYYEPQAMAYHRGHGSGGRGRYSIRLRAEKNRYLMLAKNDTVPSQLAHAWPLLLYEAWHLAKLVLQPWLWPAYILLLAALPGAWAKRLVARRVIPANQVAQLFVPRTLQPPPRAEPPAPEHGALETRGEIAVRQANVGAVDRARSADEVFPLASVVVVNYNGLALTRRCLEALAGQTYSPLEVIVIDNGSAADEGGMLGLQFPEARMLRLERNQGFSGGVNWGVSLARGEYIVLLNNDALPEEDCIRQLVYAARRTGAPAVSGRLVDITREEDIIPALALAHAELDIGEPYIGDVGERVESALAESRRNHGLSLLGYIVQGAYAQQQACFYPSGGLCVLSRTALTVMLPELLPQRYFAYHEDVHLGFALRARGGSVAKEHRAVAVHLAGSTARGLGRLRLRYLMERNRWLNLLGWLPGSVIIKLLPLTALVDACHFCAMLARPMELLGWIGARFWLLTHPLDIAHWRLRCRAQKSVPDAQWQRELSGNLRGNGGALNALSRWWCRSVGILHREA